MILPPLRDNQDRPPSGWCVGCGCELYPYDSGGLCETCKEENEDDENWNEQTS